MGVSAKPRYSGIWGLSTSPASLHLRWGCSGIGITRRPGGTGARKANLRRQYRSLCEMR
jgi:hypothetical protein